MSTPGHHALAAALNPIDLRFAELLQRKAAPEQADTIALTAALLSYQRAQGHSCIYLDEWAGRPFPDETGPELPDAAGWREDLNASELVSDGTEAAPLVLDAGGRVYLYRFWRAEQRLAKCILSRVRAGEDDLADLAPYFQKLFPGSPSDETDWQARAAAACLRSRFAVVSGGPGTGKTYTVARILALLMMRDADARVALAAPTGKAAARLAETVGRVADKLPVAESVREQIPREAQTLHRLLGYQPDTDRFRHCSDRPLALDTVIVDEASMVDLLLMDALFDALSPGTRVILLGDSGQLASVGSGNVFGDICRAAGGARPSSSFAAAYRRLTGRDVPSEPEAGPLQDSVVELRKNWRFQDQPGIATLADAIRAGEDQNVLEVLSDSKYPDVARIAPEEEDRLAAVAPHLEAVANAETVARALERLAAVRILCALRRGRWDAEGMNDAVELHLRRQCGGHGRPIMVTVNDYAVRLFNGDVGMWWTDEGSTWAWFPDTDPELRRIPLAKLPPHETAWAMTVHKSQGSEFDHVLLVLPDQEAPVLTRELLYTGVTRARKTVHIIGDPEFISRAVKTSAVRGSGLQAALGTGDGPTATSG